MPRRRTLLLLSAFALLSLPFFPAYAAPVPAPKPVDDSVSASAAALLEHRKAQKELKLSAEQRIVILDGLADIEEEHSDRLNELSRRPDANEQDFDKAEKRRQKEVDTLLANTAAKTLTAAQRTRLQQIDYHVRGVYAFTDPRVEEKLKLTDAQKKAAKDASERVVGELEGYFDRGDEGGVNRKTEVFDFRKARLKELVATLTADQKAAWEALLGTAPTGFDADELWLKIEEEKDLSIGAG